MSFSTDNLLRAISRLSALENIKATVSSSVKAGAIVGATTMISGMALGPIGLAAGGIISSCLASYFAQGEFKSILYILRYETTSEEKEILARELRGLLNMNNIISMRSFISQLESNRNFEAAVIQIIVLFVSNVLGRSVQAY